MAVFTGNILKNLSDNYEFKGIIKKLIDKDFLLLDDCILVSCNYGNININYNKLEITKIGDTFMLEFYLDFSKIFHMLI